MKVRLAAECVLLNTCACGLKSGVQWQFYCTLDFTHTHTHTHTHIFTQLLHSTLKRGKTDSTSREQLEMLDPFVPLLTSSLSSQNVKLLSRSLHCISALLRLPLPALEENMSDISSCLFEVLRKYARSGAVGANRELIFAAFKVHIITTHWPVHVHVSV